MYKHLLLPADDSPLSEGAMRRGVQFARHVGAKVTGFYAVPDFRGMAYTIAMVDNSRATFETQAMERAEAVLAFVQSVAQQGGVPCDTVMPPAAALTKPSSKSHETAIAT